MLTTAAKDQTTRPSSTRHTRAAAAFSAMLALALFAAACGSDSAGPTGLQGETGARGPQGEPGPVGPSGNPADDQTLPLDVSGAALDAHTHIMGPELTEILAGPGVPASTADDLIAELDAANVERAVVLSLAYFPELADQAAVQAENDYTAAEVDKFPERLIGFCGIDPLRPFALDEIDRCDEELGMTGVKLHPVAVNLDLADSDHADAMNAVFDRLAERDLPALMHAGAPLGLGLDSDGIATLATIIGSHPDVRLTLAHCTNDADRDEMETWITGLQQGFFNVDNLFVETSSCLEFYKDAPAAQKELMVWRLREWGLDRVLMGSDHLQIQSVETPREAIETLRSYPFTQEEIDTILSNDGSAWLG